MNPIPFVLTTEFIELFKLLKATGLCESGGMAKHAVSQSEVKVDGQVETRKGCKIRKGQQVEFGGETILVV
ncbi:MAG: RNA-binding S4 domain-containing protein [Candidatus Omnitrophica bacterium]|nr:RNA-binding S4 domain-containing protein [Candidatus Omnitrophota bacterium]